MQSFDDCLKYFEGLDLPYSHSFHDFHKYFELLDLPKTAEHRDIKVAYRRKLQKFVSSYKSSPESELSSIQEAYKILSNPDLRCRYADFVASGGKGVSKFFVMPEGAPGGILTAEGAVNGHPVNAIPDTGAGCNLVSSSLARRLGFEPPSALSEEQTSLRLANGKTIMSAGAINAMWSFAHDPQRHWNNSFQIISDFAYDIVLGSEFLAASGTMNEHRARLSKTPRPPWATSLLFTGSIGSVSQRFQGTIDGVAVQALADSGSESNLVSLSFARSHRDWHRTIDWKDQRLLQFPDGKFEKTMGSVWAHWASLSQSISPSSCDDAAFQFHILESCIHDVILGHDALEEIKAFTEHAASFVEPDRGPEPAGFNLVIWIPTKRPKMGEVTDVDATPPSRQNQQSSNEHRNSGPQIQAWEILNGLRACRSIWLEMMAKGRMTFERKRECRRRTEVVRAIRVMAPGPERDAAVAKELQARRDFDARDGTHSASDAMEPTYELSPGPRTFFLTTFIEERMASEARITDPASEAMENQIRDPATTDLSTFIEEETASEARIHQGTRESRFFSR